MPKGLVFVKPVLERVLDIPDFVQTPSPGVANAEWLSEAVGLALLLAVVTFALLHYWAAGITSQGGGGLLIEGVVRCLGAGFLILAWPFLFPNAGNLTNAVSHTLLPGHAIDATIDATAKGLGLLIGAGFGVLIVGIGLIVVFLAMFICLLLVKIGLLTGLLVAFVGMPIAIALWPVPSLSAPAGYGVRFIGMAFTVVILWAICFKVFGAVNAEMVTWGNGLSIGKRLTLPLLGLAELAALISVPRHAVTMWNVAARRGTVGSMATFAMSNVLSGTLRSLGLGVTRGVTRSGGGAGSALARRAARYGQRSQSRRSGGDSSDARPSGSGSNDSGPSGGGSNGGGPSGGGIGALPSGNGSSASEPGGNGAGAASGTSGRTRKRGGHAGARPKARPKPGSGRRLGAVYADSLPQGSSEQNQEARQRADKRRLENPPGPAAVGEAIGQVRAADRGRYNKDLDALLARAGKDPVATRGDEQVTARMSAAAAAPNLPTGLGGAFADIAAADPATRKAALAARLSAASHSESNLAQPPAPPPQAPLSQPVGGNG
jgi:hypothetical protein